MQKSFGRLIYNDLITCPDALLKLIGKENFETIERFRNISFEDALVDKDLERSFVQGEIFLIFRLFKDFQYRNVYLLKSASLHYYAVETLVICIHLHYMGKGIFWLHLLTKKLITKILDKFKVLEQTEYQSWL